MGLFSILVFILGFLLCVLKKEFLHPNILFLMIWFLILLFNTALPLYSPIAFETAFFIVACMLLIFFTSLISIRSKKIEIKENKEKIALENKVIEKFVIFLSLLTLFYCIIFFRESFGLKSVTKFIYEYRRATMYNLPYPGIFNNLLFQRILKNIVPMYTMLIFLFLVNNSSRKKIVYYSLLFLFIKSTITFFTGARFEFIFDFFGILILNYNKNILKKKHLFYSIFIFFIFFIIAGNSRSSFKFNFEYVLMYIFGGLKAFDFVYFKGTDVYIPSTFNYLKKILGMKITNNIVGESIVLNENLKTNTFTIFGPLYNEVGIVGTIIYFLILGFLLNFFYYKKNNRYLGAIYYGLFGTVLVSFFTESLFNRLPYILRYIIILLTIKIISNTIFIIRRKDG